MPLTISYTQFYNQTQNKYFNNKNINLIFLLILSLLYLNIKNNLTANNINIKTGNDAIISGANITAQSQTQKDKDGNVLKDKDGNDITIGGNLTANIGNNLTVESLQDTLYSKSKSSNFNIGIGVGTGDMGKFVGNGQSNKGNATGNIGFGNSKSNTDSAWVNNQTSLTADNKVDIKVGTREEIKDSDGNIIQTAGEGKTNIKGAVINSNSGNLTLETKELAYNDIKDFYKEESKGFQFGTGAGGSTNAGESSLAPKGSTTVGLTSTGSEREQNTKATIGNGSIVVKNKVNGKEIIIKEDGTTNQNDLLADLNRDTNNTQQITKDMITGALDGSMTVDNRLFTKSGRESIGKDFNNFGGNTKKTIIGAGQSVDMIVETTYKVGGVIGETVGGETGKAVFDGILKYTVGSTIGGVASAFGETNSKLIVADKDSNGNILKDDKGNVITKTITREELATGDYKNYEVLGVMSGEKGAIAEIILKPNTVERSNPTDGAIGDLIESGLMKVFNYFDASDMMAMSREVSLDLKTLSTIPDSINILNANFHSQGTIIEQGALQIYRDQYQTQTPLNPKINYNSLGFAVYENEIRKIFSEDLSINSKIDDPNKKVNFDRDPLDPVQQVTSPKGVVDFMTGWKNLLFNVDTHSVNNNRYDKYYDSVNLVERSKIDMNRYGNDKVIKVNLVSPGNNNNNKANYVIPKYSDIRSSK